MKKVYRSEKYLSKKTIGKALLAFSPSVVGLILLSIGILPQTFSHWFFFIIPANGIGAVILRAFMHSVEKSQTG